MQRFHKLYLLSTLRDFNHSQQIGLSFEGRPDSEVQGRACRLPWSSSCTKIGLVHIARVHLDIVEHSC